MADHLVLNDPLARLVWRLYFLRAQSILAAAPSATRIELLADLKNHLWELMAPIEDPRDERKMLRVALTRVGDPSDFLAPLLATADAVPGWQARIRHFQFHLTRASVFLISVVAMGSLLIVGLAVFGASIGSLFDASRFGVFLNGESSIRIGTNSGLETGSYRQILSPLTAVLLAAASGAAIVGAIFALRALLLRALALTYTASLRVLL